MSDEPLPIQLYQGCANSWECDEMGHLNVRFHVERAMIGVAALAERLAMPRAFTSDASATIIPLEAHIRFLREARPGAPLTMRGGIVERSETGAVAYAELRHIDGQVSSTFRLNLAHVDARSLKPFPWASRSRHALGALTCEIPAHAQPRSIDLKRAPAQIDRARVEHLKPMLTARQLITPAECDAFGRMRGEMFIARVSDAVPFLLHDWRRESAEAVAKQDGVAREAGGAAVEFRIVFRRWPRAGDHLEVRSAVTEVMEKANRIVHWIVDPVTGQAWASVEAIAITFDLMSRKSFAAPEAARNALAKRAIPEMRV